MALRVAKTSPTARYTYTLRESYRVLAAKRRFSSSDSNDRDDDSDKRSGTA